THRTAPRSISPAHSAQCWVPGIATCRALGISSPHSWHSLALTSPTAAVRARCVNSRASWRSISTCAISALSAMPCSFVVLAKSAGLSRLSAARPITASSLTRRRRFTHPCPLNIPGACRLGIGRKHRPPRAGQGGQRPESRNRQGGHHTLHTHIQGPHHGWRRHNVGHGHITGHQRRTAPLIHQAGAHAVRQSRCQRRLARALPPVYDHNLFHNRPSKGVEQWHSSPSCTPPCPTACRSNLTTHG